MNAILMGYGRMGRMIEEVLVNAGHAVSGAVDFGRYASPFEIAGGADVIIDFSHPDNLEKTLAYAEKMRIPAIIGTTNLTAEDKERIRKASESTPVVYSTNFSLGVAVMKKAAKMLRDALGGAFDIEIVEAHHSKKADAPSGTAKALADAIDPDHMLPRVYGREGVTGARGNEIGIHAVRGGTVAGEHRVMFLGEDEILEIRHEAASRRIFAAGAVRAAESARGLAPGLYTMEDLLWG